MPGYMMHLAEAKLILKEHYGKMISHLDADWCNAFYLGALLPDTKPRGTKGGSHFWRKEDYFMLARAPYLPGFLEIYQKQLGNPTVLGYLAHLHLDACYVKQYWPSAFAFYNDAGESETAYDKVTKVELLKNGQVIDRAEFFSDAYYYGDYSRLNAYFRKRYGVVLPEYPSGKPLDVPIDQVQEKELGDVLAELQGYLQKPVLEDGMYLRTMRAEDLEQFLEQSAKKFAGEYGWCLPKQS